MKQSFWSGRWSEGRIGFHKDEPNVWLVKHLDQFDIEPSSPILVPLCGKSVDLLWLATKGFHVTGVEFVPQALDDFIDEHQLSAIRTEQFGLTTAKINVGPGTINYLVADFLDFPEELAPHPKFIYDRAALIALPEDIRRNYTRRIIELAQPGTEMLLVTVEYPKDKADGPPFSILPEDVEEYYGSAFRIESLQAHSSAPLSERLKSVGIAEVTEQIYKLVRN